MSSIFRFYGGLMKKQPFLTQCCTTGILVATGDVISQKLIEQQSELNVKRTLRFAAFGLVFVGPSISIWFRVLDKKFLGKIVLKPWQKVLVDQSTFNPILNLCAFPVLGLLNQHSFDQIKSNVNENYVDIMKANYKIWPFVQLVNFYYVPLLYRAVFVSGFSIIWNTYYTWKLGEKQPQTNTPKSPELLQ